MSPVAVRGPTPEDRVGGPVGGNADPVVLDLLASGSPGRLLDHF